MLSCSVILSSSLFDVVWPENRGGCQYIFGERLVWNVERCLNSVYTPAFGAIFAYDSSQTGVIVCGLQFFLIEID